MGYYEWAVLLLLTIYILRCFSKLHKKKTYVDLNSISLNMSAAVAVAVLICTENIVFSALIAILLVLANISGNVAEIADRLLQKE